MAYTMAYPKFCQYPCSSDIIRGVYKTWATPCPRPTQWPTLWPTPNFVILPIIKEKTNYVSKIEGWPDMFFSRVGPRSFFGKDTQT